MSNKELVEVQYMWMIMYDPMMRHFSLDLSTDSTISAEEFIEGLQDFVDRYKENPKAIFKDSGETGVIQRQ